MNKTLKTINEGFDRKYLVEASTKLKMRLSSQLINKIIEILKKDLQNRIRIDIDQSKISDEDRDNPYSSENRYLQHPYLFDEISLDYSRPYTWSDTDKSGKKKKQSRFDLDTLYNVTNLDVSFNRQEYKKITDQAVHDIKELLNKNNVQYDSVDIYMDENSWSIRIHLYIEQHEFIQPKVINNIEDFDSLYITVPIWYRIKPNYGNKTLCFGAVDKSGFFRLNSIANQGVQGGTQVTFTSKEEAEAFISANKLINAKISKSKATDLLIPVKTQSGYAYATKRFINEHKASRYPLPIIDYDVHASVDIDWDLNDPTVFTDDDFSDY